MAGEKDSLDIVREIGHILNEQTPASVEFLRFEETHWKGRNGRGGMLLLLEVCFYMWSNMLAVIQSDY